MKDRSETPITSTCGRAETTLVAYLYGEADKGEAKDFESHLSRCEACEAELASFASVRTSIAGWRQQMLGATESTAPATQQQLAPTPETVKTSSTARQRSALAALREFFALSPVWLRAGTAFASLMICALVVFAVARVMEGPRVVERIVERGPSEAEVNALVDKRVRERVAIATARVETTAPQQQQQQFAAPSSARKDSILAQSKAGRSSSLSRRDGASLNSRARASAREEYEQLAQDLQLIPARDEEDLPRLIDLMDEAN
ncbi:MAG TPA: zf-HC2 domain-containing protein [Pyrinomonadaceae bacterium]|jgi:anti-sigma factor RsiW|nr:zf-HC2 domain-containing protein [Pyrinomonadaceae bacterium]